MPKPLVGVLDHAYNAVSAGQGLLSMEENWAMTEGLSRWLAGKQATHARAAESCGGQPIR